MTAKRAGLALGTILLLAIVSVAVLAWTQAAAFDASLHGAHDVALPHIARSDSAADITRGKQLADSVGACTTSTCHGVDLAGGRTIRLGPAATISGPNITGATLDAYSDGELARLMRYGVKRDGTGVLFMPVQNFSWLPDSDIAAIISWLRTVLAVERPSAPSTVSVIGKFLDRRGRLVLDVARHVEETPPDAAPEPAPTANYGRFVSRACTMCHGERLSGGALPGAPSSMPVPLNLAPDESGLRDWSYEDFDRLLTTGVRRNGKKLDPFMPVEAFSKYDETQKRALWSYLQSLPPTPLGRR